VAIRAARGHALCLLSGVIPPQEQAVNRHYPNRSGARAGGTMQLPLVSALAKILLLTSAMLHPAIASAAVWQSSRCSAVAVVDRASIDVPFAIAGVVAQ